MNAVLDTLYLRRPRLEYVSPAICEALFSSSSEPVIVLSEISRYRGPTGLRRGVGGGEIFFNWGVIPGVVCYNIYHTPNPDDPNGLYTLVNECIPAGSIFVCSAGTYYVTVITSDGESAPTPSFVCDGVTPVIFPLPQLANTICYNLYKDAVLHWSCFEGMAYEVCDGGCYKVSGISPDGETELSEEICFDCITEEECLPTQVWDWETCSCIVCPEQTCPEGETWNPLTCACEGGGPPGPCDAFIDVFGTSVASDVAKNGTGVLANFDDAVVFISRVQNTWTTDGGSPLLVDSAGAVYGEDSGVNHQKFHLSQVGTLTTFGPDIAVEPYTLVGVSETGLLAYNRLVGHVVWAMELWSLSGGVVATISDADNVRSNFNSLSPTGDLLFSYFNVGLSQQEYWIRRANGSFVDLGLAFQSGERQCLNIFGQAAITVRKNSLVEPARLYFWNGTSLAEIYNPGTPVLLGGASGVSGLNTFGTIVFTVAGLPYKWTFSGGVVPLGLPGGAASVSLIFVDDNELIQVVANTGVFYYWNGVWGLASDIYPITATPWSAINGIQKVARDGHVIGNGTYSGGYRSFLAKCCPPT